MFKSTQESIPYLTPSDEQLAKKVFNPIIEYCLKKGATIEKKKRKYEKQQ